MITFNIDIYLAKNIRTNLDVDYRNFLFRMGTEPCRGGRHHGVADVVASQFRGVAVPDVFMAFDMFLFFGYELYLLMLNNSQ